MLSPTYLTLISCIQTNQKHQQQTNTHKTTNDKPFTIAQLLSCSVAQLNSQSSTNRFAILTRYNTYACIYVCKDENVFLNDIIIF